MKLDRLLSIVILLLNRRKMLAQELADHFEVSVRTIYRDIEAINQAGIPVITYQGAGGGIGLMDGYRLDRNLLTDEELATIATALRSLSTSQAGHDPELLLEKIASIIPESRTTDFDFRTKQLIVDMSAWGRQGHLEQKLTSLREAIEQMLAASFTYVSAEGAVTQRIVHPHTLVLKGHAWYLYAYCVQREEFRLFKLFRMKDVHVLASQPFERKSVEPELMPWNVPRQGPGYETPLTLRFNESGKHMAEEQFGVEALQADGTGRYVVEVDYPEDRWLYGFLLSFGPDVEVLGPRSIRDKVRTLVAATADIYKDMPET